MCNALSPERAVIWSVLHDHAPADLSADHFLHPAYRMWFEAARLLREEGKSLDAAAIEAAVRRQKKSLSDRDRRALRRMLRIAPPARIADNVCLLGQALIDRHAGKAVHIERLIN